MCERTLQNCRVKDDTNMCVCGGQTVCELFGCTFFKRADTRRSFDDRRAARTIQYSYTCYYYIYEKTTHILCQLLHDNPLHCCVCICVLPVHVKGLCDASLRFGTKPVRTQKIAPICAHGVCVHILCQTVKNVFILNVAVNVHRPFPHSTSRHNKRRPIACTHLQWFSKYLPHM